MFSYDEYINEKRNFYVEYSKKVERKQEDFKKHHLKVVDIENATILDIKHNYLQNAKNDYLWFVYNQKLLEQEMLENDEYSVLFLTLTLSSSFHKYHKKSKRYNSKHDKEHTIKKGYELLNNAHRDIYKNFFVNRKFEKTKFSKVIEFHHDFTPHLHALVYVRKECVKSLIKHIKQVVKNYGLGEHKIEVINDLSRSTSYLLKYINKTTNPKNEESFHVLNGWKKYNKIRMFTCSNKVLSRYVFDKVNRTLKVTKGLKGNPISKVLDTCEIETKIVDKKEDYEKTKKIGNSANAKHSVIIEKKRYKKHLELDLKSENRDYMNHILNDNEYLDTLALKCGLCSFDKEIVNHQINQMKSLVYSYHKTEKELDVLKEFMNGVRFSKINIQQKNYKKSNTRFDDINELNKMKIENYYSKIYNECSLNEDILENKRTQIIESLKKFKKIDGGYKYLYQLKEFKIIDNKTKGVLYDKANYKNFLDLNTGELEKYFEKNI